VIDMFFHDSDHSYRNQEHEYSVFYERLRPGGFLVSDDIDASYAFLDFCRRHSVRPGVLIAQRKLLGVVRKV
jgi:predicted O-methyltransferase YrrM